MVYNDYANALMAVSYTHLDVYKRQFVYSRTKAGLYKYFMESGVIPMFQKTGKHANHAMKGGDTMKKLSALLLSIAMLMVCVVSVSAAPVESSASPAGFVGDLFDVTSQNKTAFYVQRLSLIHI